MRKLLISAVCVLSLASASHAASLNFGKKGARSIGDVENQVMTFGRVAVEISSSSNQRSKDTAFLNGRKYGRNSGLGVCQTADCTGMREAAITSLGEWVKLDFINGPVDLSRISMRTARHGLIGANNTRDLRISVNGGPMEQLSFGDLKRRQFNAVESLKVAFARSNKQAFFLSSMVARPVNGPDLVDDDPEPLVPAVPVPAALPLLAGALALSGVALRRRKRS